MTNTRKFSAFDDDTLSEAVGLGQSGNNAKAVPSGGGGGGSSGVTKEIVQNNSFDVGDWVRLDGSDYILARANNSTNAEVLGVVSAATSTEFTLQQSGYIADITDAGYTITAGEVMFLSETVAGELQIADVTTVDAVSRPCLVADTNTGGWIIPYRGQIQSNGGTSTPGGGGTGSTFDFDQAMPSFDVGDAIKVSGAGTFAKAQADSFANAQAIGLIVEKNVDGIANRYRVQTEGYTDALSSLAPNTLYYLSGGTAGELDPAEPTDSNYYSKPMLVALSATEGFILEQRQLPVASSDDATFVFINQNFAVGKALRVSGSGTYTTAIATSLANSQAVGIVVWSDGAANCILQTNGYTDKLTVANAASLHYLSSTSSGDLTITEPTTTGQVSKPLFFSSTVNDGYILEQRPMLQPNANGGGGGGMLLVNTFIIPGGSSTLNMDDIFLGGYEKYEIELYNITAGAAQNAISLRFGTGSGPVTYAGTGYGYNNAGTAPTLYNQTSMTVTSGFLYGGVAQFSLSGTISVYDPTNTAFYKRLSMEGTYVQYSGASAFEERITASGGWSSLSAASSLQLLTTFGGPLSGGTIKVYALT